MKSRTRAFYLSVLWWNSIDPFASKMAGYQSAPALGSALRYLEQSDISDEVCVSGARIESQMEASL